MKTLTTLLVAMLVSALTFAQQETKIKLDEIKVTPPQFTGSYDAAQLFSVQNNATFNNLLRDHLMDKAKTFNGAIEGTEVVHFVVGENGKITDFEVINSISSQVDRAVYEFLKTTCGMWKPGENNGEPVAMEKEISVILKMVDATDFDELAVKYLAKGTEELFVNDKPKKALKYLNHGMKYRPNEDCLLVSRGICKYELGDKIGAEDDWNRMAQSGISDNAKELATQFSHLKGYSALTAFLENK